MTLICRPFWTHQVSEKPAKHYADEKLWQPRVNKQVFLSEEVKHFHGKRLARYVEKLGKGGAEDGCLFTPSECVYSCCEVQPWPSSQLHASQFSSCCYQQPLKLYWMRSEAL